MAAANPLRPALFRFLSELAENNRRDWFQKNKERYEADVRWPALQFIEAFAPRLEKLSPHLLATPKPVGGSLMRIHRDTRFAKDKTPYKTNVGIQFRHEAGKDVHAPGIYLHLEPGGCFLGAGIWHPETAVARTLREAIAADPAGWKKAVHSKAFLKDFELAGDSLKRPPPGFDREHPLVEDLKRKDFIAVAKLPRKTVTGPTFATDLARLCRGALPLMRFSCRALELPF